MSRSALVTLAFPAPRYPAFFSPFVSTCFSRIPLPSLLRTRSGSSIWHWSGVNSVSPHSLLFLSFLSSFDFVPFLFVVVWTTDTAAVLHSVHLDSWNFAGMHQLLH